MAKRFLTNIDLSKNQLLNAVIHPSASAPSSPVKGQVYTDNANGHLMSYNGSGWDDLAAGVPSGYVGQTTITTLGTITTGTWNGTAIGIGYGGTGATTAAGARTALGTPGKFSQTLSTSATSYTVNHALNTTDIVASVKDTATLELVNADITVTDANNITVAFATAPAANAFRVVVMG